MLCVDLYLKNQHFHVTLSISDILFPLKLSSFLSLALSFPSWITSLAFPQTNFNCLHLLRYDFLPFFFPTKMRYTYPSEPCKLAVQRFLTPIVVGYVFAPGSRLHTLNYPTSFGAHTYIILCTCTYTHTWTSSESLWAILFYITSLHPAGYIITLLTSQLSSDVWQRYFLALPFVYAWKWSKWLHSLLYMEYTLNSIQNYLRFLFTFILSPFPICLIASFRFLFRLRYNANHFHVENVRG